MLYNQQQEKDNCGFGLIAHIDGVPSHKVVRTAIHGLARMQHRGAILADGKTGDGCGLLLQKPDRFFRMVAKDNGWRLATNYAVGMLFLSQDEKEAQLSREIVEQELLNETLSSKSIGGSLLTGADDCCAGCCAIFWRGAEDVLLALCPQL